MKIIKHSNVTKITISPKDWKLIGLQAGWFKKEDNSKQLELKNLLQKCNEKQRELEDKAKQALNQNNQELLKQIRFQISNVKQRRESILEAIDAL